MDSATNIGSGDLSSIPSAPQCHPPHCTLISLSSSKVRHEFHLKKM
jgi:hypothetical protein